MPKAIVIRQYGGAEVLKAEEVSLGKPKGDQLLIRHKAIGLNYIDIYHRTGLYKLPSLPAVIGMEGVGEVLDAGPDCQFIKPGMRVGYCTASPGAYSEQRLISEKFLLPIPDHVTDEVAAAILLKGLTAHYLIRRTYNVNPQSTILVHAAAGGTGQIICQWAKYLGAKVIGTAGSKEKGAIAQENGCDQVILYREEDIVEKVNEFTGGRGVNAVYDSVGKDTFAQSLECLMKFGIMVSFGQSSGPVEPFSMSVLAKKSLYLTRPTLMHYKEDRHELLLGAAELFDLLGKEKITLRIHQQYALAEVAKAHAELEGRKTTGASILIP